MRSTSSSSNLGLLVLQQFAHACSQSSETLSDGVRSLHHQRHNIASSLEASEKKKVLFIVLPGVFLPVADDSLMVLFIHRT